AELERAAARVRLPGARGPRAVDQVSRDRREQADAGGGDVDVLRVPIRERRYAAEAADRADADHVRQRRRVVGEPPGRRRRPCPLPTAATTTAPLPYAYAIAAASSAE